MQSKFVPPAGWAVEDAGGSPYNLDDFEDTPWPPPGAIEVSRAEGSEANVATLEFAGGIVISCTWTEDSFQITYRVCSQHSPEKAVWVGFGPVAENRRYEEEWYEAGPASTEEQSRRFNEGRLIRPTEERWWLMALVDKSCGDS